MFVRRRGASAELRKQLAWLGYVGALTVLWALVLAVASVVAPGPANSRTFAYAIVTGLLIGLYAGLVLLATEVLTITSPVAVAASTLAVAALFNPLRHRVQHAVDRRFNRTRYDADQTVTAFAARLQDAVDQDAVHDDLLRVVQRSLEPTHATVWVRPAS